MNNSNNESKRFSFYQTYYDYREGGQSWLIPYKGPYFNSWIELIGEKELYTIEEIEKLPLSKSLKSRILSCREGSKVRLHALARDHYLYLRRVPTEEINKETDVNSIKEQLKDINKKIRDKCGALFVAKSVLEKKLKELKATKEDKWVLL